MKVLLVLLDGAHRGHRVKLNLADRAEVTFGRARGNRIRLPSERISRRHCKVWLERKKLWVQDMGSQNGTFVNDEVAIGKVQLQPDDELMLAHVRFKVEFDPNDIEPGPTKERRPPARKKGTPTFGDVDPDEMELVPLDEPKPIDFDLPMEEEDEKPKRKGKAKANETYDIPVHDPADFRDILRELDEGSEDD